MYGFAYMARGLALLAFLTVGCGKETEEQIAPPLGGQASSSLEGETVDDDTCIDTPRFEVIDYDAEQSWVLGRVVTPPGPRPLPGTGATITEIEPNSSMDAANQMNLGDDFFSNISFLEDSDYVRFTLTQQTQLSIHTVLGTLSTSFLVLYSSSGEFLAHSSSNGYGAPSPHIELTLEAGTYFIQAGTYYSEYSGTQIVQLRQLGDLPPAPITHTSPGDGPYKAFLDGCWRSGGNSWGYTLNTQVRFELPNSAPVSRLSSSTCRPTCRAVALAP